MSARIASNMYGSLLLRGALLVGAALALAACGGGQKAVKKEKDAATYNTQLGIAYLRQGEIPLAKEKLDRALKENPNNPACTVRARCCTTGSAMPPRPTGSFRPP